MKSARLLSFAVSIALAALIMSPAAATAAPVDWEQLEVTVHSEGASAVTIITGTLPEQTRLPAEVSIAVPTGSEYQWAGEILGGDPSADPAVEPSKTTEGAFDTYTFTLRQARIGQLELAAGPFFQFGNAEYRGSLTWVPATDLNKLTLSVLIPQGAQLTTITPEATVVPGPSNGSYVTRSFDDIQAGDEAVIGAVYTQPAAPAGAAQAAASDSLTPVIVVLLIAAAAAVGAIIAISRKSRRASGYVAVDEDDEPRIVESSAFDDEEQPAAAIPPARPSSKSASLTTPAAPAAGQAKRANVGLIVTGLIIVVVVVAGVMASQTSSSVTELPNGFSRTYSQGDPCNKLTFALASKPTKDVAEKMLEALVDAAPLSAIAYTDGSPRLEVTFCDSVTTPQRIETALAPTGLVGEVVPNAQPGTAQ